MTWIASLTILLLATQTFATIHGHVIHDSRRGRTVEGRIRRYADSLVDDQLERRQVTATSLGNTTSWDAQTTAACMSSLSMLNGVATNPVGMAVCYNLPFLDNSTGVFQADLRLYMVSAPAGDFAGVPAQNVGVSLAYFGASVSRISPSELKSIQARTTQSEHDLNRRATPSLVTSYAFVGQINKNLMTSNMNTTYLQGLLIPDVTLSATNSAGTNVQSTLSSDEATFVNGVFSDQANATTIAAEAASASAAAAAASAAAPFVLPGRRILIFPIGAFITGLWAFIGMATIMYGTIGRIRFRDRYRRMVTRADKGSYRRI